MQCLEYSKKRLHTFLQEIARLKGAEFPYVYAERALDLIETFFADFLEQLERTTARSNKSSIRAACAAELTGLYQYLPFLGFILRSTNPRNAFEVHGPLLRLAREVVKPDIKLIYSSEWDYSPLTYLGIPHLPDFVLIGLPAHEADNPLVLPLAGHELGHSIWATEDLSQKFEPKIADKIVAEISARFPEYQNFFPDVKTASILQTDIFAQRTWSRAATWGTKQAEEIFCDFVGLHIFGESYLHAFAYLLSPKLLLNRSGFYPNLRKRVEYLLKASTRFAVAVPADYADEFADMASSASPQDAFLLSVADAASASIVDDLLQTVDQIVTQRIKKPRSEAGTDAIFKDFQLVAPACEINSIADILNAGWKAFHDQDFWKDISQIECKDRTLKELILKSIEVFEYERLLEVPL